MTTKQYEEYKQAVERNLKGLEHLSTGTCPNCGDCGLSDEPTEHERELAEEPHFSWSACDSCGSTLGGDRHPAHAWMKQVEHDAEVWVRGEKHTVHIPAGPDLLIHLDVCTDCLYYLNYGRLDDATMMEIEKQ